MLKPCALGIGLLLATGCTSYGVIDNAPRTSPAVAGSYSIAAQPDTRDSGDISLLLAFSGGGTRAAALAYGVLQELRDTSILIDGHPVRVLDEVDAVSSVSGGSFTAAYFGLHGDRIFTEFEDSFLRRNIQRRLLRALINPIHWFSSTGRTELAVKFYETMVFHGATFADLQRAGGPIILINASDLGYGVRFSFTQEYFNLLCSDISSFPVARAVTASSAVPVLFNPVVLENYLDCKHRLPDWLMAAQQRTQDDPQLAQVVAGLKSYFKKDGRRYAHFVDGGITDNLGLRAIYEVVEIAGGMRSFLRHFDREPPRRLAIISVNASTAPVPKMDRSNRQPSLEETIGAVTDVQLHRYNAATLKLMDTSVKRWARELSTRARPITSYFVQISFRDIEQPDRIQFFNRIPTSFSLSGDQVDALIAAGRELLRENADYQRLLADLGGPRRYVGRR